MNQEINSLFFDIKSLIQQSRQRVSVAVNAEITLLYWHIGKRIHNDILNQQKADYGKQQIASLSKQLTQEFGKGWSSRQLFYCLKIADVFPDENILHALCAKLSWSHIRLIMNRDNPLERQFYIEICQ